MRVKILKVGFLVLAMISTNNLLAFTAVTSGSWSDAATWGGTAPSGNVSNQDITIPSGITVDMDMDVAFSGLLNSFTVDGTLTSSGSYQLFFQSGTFNGSGDVEIRRVEFSGLLTGFSFSGDMSVESFANMGAILAVTSQVTVSDSLYLESGSFTLNTGGNLMVDSAAIIVRDGGSLATSGGVFNSGAAYHVHYIGGSKTTGIEINSLNLQNMEINLDSNTDVITMGSDLKVMGDLLLNTGILSVGANDLEIHGNIQIQSGAAFTSGSSSVIILETGNNLNSGLIFTSGSSVDQLTINHSGSAAVALESPLDISGELQLMEGSFSIESGATLTMNAGSTVQVMNGSLEGNGGTFVGTASYHVEYLGDSTITTGEEITGTGLNDVTVNIQQGEVILDDDMTVGGTLELIGGKLNLNANDLVVNGSLDQDEDSPFVGDAASDLELHITLIGNDTIWFDPSDQNLERLVLDVTGGNIVLGSKLQIKDELTMTAGSISLMNEDLIIEENADITGYSDTRYIHTPHDGMLQMHVALSSPYVVFPVGTNSSYSPASIQGGSGAVAGNFMVKAFNGVFMNGTESNGFNAVTNGASLVNRTWLIESDASAFDMNLKLGWVATAETNGFDRTDAYISHYTGGNWDTYASGTAVSGTNNTYEITRTGITSLSPFAVADGDAELIVNEAQLLTLNLYPNPCSDALNIHYENGTADYRFEVTDLAGRSYETLPAGVNQLNVSALNTGTYLLKMINTETNKVLVKPFVKN